ncbi:MAG: hypothetical protein CL561_02255 [Alphaproteobacteria bacterium]|nr:hypothetical protein [Alphaproteobacteria bacterium]|tara:strand:+ start:117689 stop:118210 length:522 start_codon:yes stop_codon:yes gene_type:complete
MAKITDKLVKHWDLQAQPLIEKENELILKLAKCPKPRGSGFFSIFNGFGDPNSREGLESRLSSIRSKQVEVAKAFTLPILKQAAGTDGKFHKRYAEYKRQREQECPGWPAVFSMDEIRKDYLQRYFLLQRVKVPSEQAHVIDQMFDFYKHDKSLPLPYRPENDIDAWLRKFDI